MVHKSKSTLANIYREITKKKDYIGGKYIEKK